MPGARTPLPRFPDAPESYSREREQEYRQVVEQALLAAVHTATIPPVVQAEAVRSGTSATLTLTIRDDDRRVTAIEFDKREGTGAATGWVSTWDSETGTIGTDRNLVRSEGISIPAGLDSAAKWRVKYRDQQGAEHILGDAVPGANLGALTKIIRIPFTQLINDRESGAWLYDSLGGYLAPNSIATEQIFVGSVLLPRGVTIAEFRARVYVETGSDQAIVTLYSNNDTVTIEVSGPLSPATTAAWEILEETGLSHLVDDESYWVQARLEGAAAGDDARLAWAEVEYTVPDYSKTY